METIAQELSNIWKKTLKLVKEKIPFSSYQAWIKPAKLSSIEANVVTLHVRNEFSRNLLIQNYYSVLETSLRIATENNNLILKVEINQNLPTDEFVPSFSSIQESKEPELPFENKSSKKNYLNKKLKINKKVQTKKRYIRHNNNNP